MNWYTRLFGWFKLVSKNVWDFVRPMILELVKVEAAGYMSLVLKRVVEAERLYGSGKGQEKYDYVIASLKNELGDRFEQTPYRVFDNLIGAAVARISE
jgi:hypothetical protein